MYILVLLEIINISSEVKDLAPISKTIESQNNLNWEGPSEVLLGAD